MPNDGTVSKQINVLFSFKLYLLFYNCNLLDLDFIKTFYYLEHLKNKFFFVIFSLQIFR